MDQSVFYCPYHYLYLITVLIDMTRLRVTMIVSVIMVDSSLEYATLETFISTIQKGYSS